MIKCQIMFSCNRIIRRKLHLFARCIKMRGTLGIRILPPQIPTAKSLPVGKYKNLFFFNRGWFSTKKIRSFNQRVTTSRKELLF